MTDSSPRARAKSGSAGMNSAATLPRPTLTGSALTVSPAPPWRSALAVNTVWTTNVDVCVTT